ncbi:threonine/serine exporter family protein [Rothia terrae]|uniref:threonine/serine exporter family protein n=1 Tax=Rothia terrae TaxID=396015 RepID=UPI0033CEABBE
MKSLEIRTLMHLMKVLLENGHSTKDIERVAVNCAHKMGLGEVKPDFDWGRCSLYDKQGRYLITSPVGFHGMNMKKVDTALFSVQSYLKDFLTVQDFNHQLIRASSIKPTYPALFIVACATGSFGLALIFGAQSLTVLGMIASVAVIGGITRQVAGYYGASNYAQVFLAAGWAGLCCGAAMRWIGEPDSALIALCPAMILVPGPHLINGVMDVVEGYISLGIKRLTSASVTLLSISAGLIVGLHIAGQVLPLKVDISSPNMAIDFLGAVLAICSYPVYFSSALKHVGYTILVGGFAHSLRWLLLAHGVTSFLADFWSCLVVGTVLGLAALWKNLSFAGVGFAAVVALVPGMYVFRTCAGIVQMATQVNAELVVEVAADFSKALVILLSISSGLLVGCGLANTGWNYLVSGCSGGSRG